MGFGLQTFGSLLNPPPEIRRAPNQDLAFGSRAEAEAHGMKIADELIYKMKAKAGQGIG